MFDDLDPEAIQGEDEITRFTNSVLNNRSGNGHHSAGVLQNDSTPAEPWLEQLEAAAQDERPKLLAALAEELTDCTIFDLAVWAENLKPYTTKTALFEAVRDARQRRKAQLAQEAQERYYRAREDNTRVATWPYAIKDNRLVYLTQTKEGEPLELVIADLWATITQEATSETGETWFTLSGKTAAGRDFSLEISAADITDERKLKAAIVQAGGSQAVIRARMGAHLLAAIQKLTPADKITQVKRYTRTGWADERFLIPGREPEGVTIHLPRKLPYSSPAGGDLAQGLGAIDALIRSMDPKRTAVILATFLQAPLAELAGWRSERYGLFVVGRTGSLKTSILQCFMSIYGSAFIDDGLIIKWGEGATRNAIMAMAAQAHDLPFLIDNYKPSTGDGERGFTNLIHNILEGGEKDRLNRASELRASKPVYCWPVITGEDLPDKDPASLARLLVVPLAWRLGAANELLTQVQNSAETLPTIGAAWLSWLESEEAQEAITWAKSEFNRMRTGWAAYLRGRRADSVNVLRVATNLATCQLAWGVAMRHPQIGPILERYHADLQAGLTEIAGQMTEYTAQALEGRRFIDQLRQLVNTGRYVLLPKLNPPDPYGEPDRVVGYRDDRGIYLHPDLARKAVLGVLGPMGLGSLSDRALNEQLNELGLIASRDEKGNQWTKPMRIAGRIQRVLHLTPAALDDEGDPDGQGGG